jgi:tRNA 2-selenouridine synthase SelU
MPFEFSVERTFEIAARLAEELHSGLADDAIKAQEREKEKPGSSYRPNKMRNRMKQAGLLKSWIAGMASKHKQLTEKKDNG